MDERGAVAVMVAVTMTVLLGMGALVLDVGALFVERRELQNGADAAALALAEACALNYDACDDPVDTASSFAASNATDGAANIDDVDLDLSDREVTVDTSTATEDGDALQLGFAGIFGIDSSSVTASATAVWAGPAELDVFRMTISDCLFDILTDGRTEFGVERTILFHDPVTELPCTGSNNNQTSPGNWGWLSSPLISGDRCIADVSIGKTPGAPGNDTECSGAQLDALIGEEFGIPIFTESTCCGSNTKYTVAGFAGFTLTGYHLGGSLENNPPCGSPDTCIAGTFTRFITHDEHLDPDAEVFGVGVVRLTK